MPRLLQIDTCLNVCSTGKIAEDIASAASSRGWDCYMAHGARYVGKSAQKSFQVGSVPAEYLHFAKSLLFDAQGKGSVLPTKRLVRWIEEINPNVIQLHCIHGSYLNYQILFEYLASKDIPVVWTIHDCWPVTGHCSHFAAVNCNKWKDGCDNCPRLDNYPKSLTDRSKSNYALKKHLFTSVKNMTLVPVSHWLEGVVKDSFLNKYPVHTIRNGINLGTFFPRTDAVSDIRDKYNLGEKYVILGVASGWNKDNGYFDFIKLRSMLGDKYTIVLVGVNDRQIAELPDGIVGIKRTDSQEELAQLYSAADIFFNGSFEETFGLVTAEAIACGTPAIVYNSTACPEIVTPETGFVIERGQLQKVAEIVENDTLMAGSNITNRRAACREYAATHFDKVQQYSDYLELYNSL